MTKKIYPSHEARRNFILSADLCRQLKEKARQVDMSQSALVRKALRDLFARMEG